MKRRHWLLEGGRHVEWTEKVAHKSQGQMTPIICSSEESEELASETDAVDGLMARCGRNDRLRPPAINRLECV